MTDTKVSKQIGVRVPLAMYAKLAALAKAERRGVGFIVKDLVDEGLQRREAQAKRGRVRS
jgi:hypothetical protein